MDKIGRGIVESPNHDDSFKEQLFKTVFNNLEDSDPGSDTLRVVIDWTLTADHYLLIKTGHERFRRLSEKNPNLFYEVIGPKFVVDLYSNGAYKNKADIIKLTETFLDIIKSNETKVLPNQAEINRAIFNIVKCFINNHATQLSVVSNAYDLMNSHKQLLPQGGNELTRFANALVEFMASYKYNESNLQELEKVGKLFPLLFSVAGEKLGDVIDEMLKTLYTCVYSSDSYDQPSPALMIVIDKIPKNILSRATDYFVNDSHNPQGEARVVVALQTMINWLTVVPNLFVSSWILRLLESLKNAERFPVLIELTHSTLEKLCYSLGSPPLQSSIEDIFLFLMLGFQHSEVAFHRLLSPLGKVLQKLKAANDSKTKKLYESLTEALVYFFRLYPNYPGLYEPLLSVINENNTLEIRLSDERAEELKKLSWIDKYDISETSTSARLPMLGLLNLGNTCYMNSILQALFLTKQFTDYSLRSSLTSSQVVLHRLQMVFAFLKLSMRSFYSPGDFLKVARPPWFEKGRQQDCSEFLRYLLDILHETEKHSRKTNVTSSYGDKLGRDMNETLRSYSTSALNSIEETDQEGDKFMPDAVDESDETPTFEIGGSISNFTPQIRAESDSDFAMGSSNSLNSNSQDMRRWTTQENLSLTEEEELTEEENDSGIQSVGDSISGSSDSMQQNEEFVSIVQRVFGGVLSSSYRCKNCGTVSIRKENFTDLNLALPTKAGSLPVSMQSLLNAYLEVEVLEGENQYHCDTCAGLQDAEKTLQFLESPAHLTCTLLRFHFDREAKRRSKIFTEISYEKTLNFPLKNGTTEEYDLYCIVFHSGYGSDSGHYYCYGRKTEDDKIWYNFNDSHVSTVKFDSFEDLSKRFPRDTPYVLFYQKRGVYESSGDNDRPLRPDLKAAVEKDNRAFLMDRDKELYKSLNRNASTRNFDSGDDDQGPSPGSGGCYSGGRFDSFGGGGRFIC